MKSRLILTSLLLMSPIHAKLMTFAWNRNPESNIDKYILKVGTETGNYTQSIDSGMNDNQTVDLVVGQTYYTIVEVQNTSGLTNQSTELIVTIAEDMSAKFITGSKIYTNIDSVRVYQCYGNNGVIVNARPLYTVGTIVGQSVVKDEYIWYPVIWTDGTIGWSRGELLSLKEATADSTTFTMEISNDLMSWESVYQVIRPNTNTEFTRVKLEN